MNKFVVAVIVSISFMIGACNPEDFARAEDIKVANELCQSRGGWVSFRVDRDSLYSQRYAVTCEGGDTILRRVDREAKR